jgi:hypothetical protein
LAVQITVFDISNLASLRFSALYLSIYARRVIFVSIGRYF